MPLRLTPLSLLSLLLLGLPNHAAAAPPRRAESTRALQQALTRLGYWESVAQQIVTADKSLAKRIVSLAKDKVTLGEHNEEGRRYFAPDKESWAPVTLYRGLRSPTFDPEHYSHRYKGDAFASTALGIAQSFARVKRSARKPHGLVLEMQVPRFLLLAGQKKRISRYPYPVIPPEVPSLLPFVHRVGEQPAVSGRLAPTPQVAWKKPSATLRYVVRGRGRRR